MHQQINKWVDFFQGPIATRFRQNTTQAIETLTSLLIGHLFGLYNLNELADALEIPRSSLYTTISRSGASVNGSDSLSSCPANTCLVSSRRLGQ